MKILKYFAFTALICWGCSKEKATDEVPLVKEVSTEKFDPKILSGVKRDKNSGAFIIHRGDTVIKVMNFNDPYIDISVGQSALTYQKGYYEKTLGIKYEVSSFYNLSVGILKKYDEKGNLVLKENLERDFSISIDELIEKVRETTGTDISKKVPGLSIHRDKVYFRYCYNVRIPVGIDTNKIRELYIDGQTGAVLRDKISYFEECGN